MLIYRFRITAADHDEFLREVEIQPNQTFLDFHHLLAETAEVKNLSGAVFSTLDKKNKIKQEITLKTTKKQVRRFDDDLGEVVLETITLPLMKDAKIKNYIEDPHQAFHYELSGKDVILMHIELFKIVQSEGIVSYPRIVRKVGELKKTAEIPVLPPVVENDEVPAVPRLPKIKPVTPKPSVTGTAKLDHIEEDIEEIKAIDDELAELLEEDAPVKFEAESQVSTTEDGEEQEYGAGEEMEHLEDFSDMDRIDERYSGYRESSDDY